MNSSPDDFENRLRDQSPRSIPPEWRAQILHAARKAASPQIVADRVLSSWRQLLRDLLWPAPAAWGALAGIWVLLFAFQWATAEAGPAFHAQKAPPTADVLAALKEQQRLWVELHYKSPDFEKSAPGPRSRNEATFVRII